MASAALRAQGTPPPGPERGYRLSDTFGTMSPSGRQFFMLALLATEAAPVPDLRLPAPRTAGRDEIVLPHHLFTDTLRAPFGDGWGGETYLYTPVGHRMSLGLFMRGWSEAVCDRPSCAERAIESGVELRYRLKPGIDLGVGMGVQRGAGARSAPAVLPRIHLKF